MTTRGIPGLIAPYLVGAFSCACVASAPTPQEAPAVDIHAAAPTDPHVDAARSALALAKDIQSRADNADARKLASEAIHALLALPEAEDTPERAAALLDLSALALDTGDLAVCRDARARVVAFQERTLPDEDPDLTESRLQLGRVLFFLGDYAAARVLLAGVVAVRERALPPEHLDLQRPRMALALAIRSLGDLETARTMLESVHEVLLRTLPDGHEALQSVRLNLGATRGVMGDLPGARELEERVLAVQERTLPDDAPALQKTRRNLALTVRKLGDVARAKKLEQRVLAVYERTLPEDHPELLGARANLANTLYALGDLHGARKLQEEVLATQERRLPEAATELQLARLNLSTSLHRLRDLAGARALQERVLAVLSETLADDHPYLQTARNGLAGTLHDLGDLRGARALREQVLAILQRGSPDDHPDLQAARTNLAVSLHDLGDLAGARALQEKVLSVLERSLPDEHLELQRARANLAAILSTLGDIAGAHALEEEVHDVLERTLPDEHYDLQLARWNLARTLLDLGDLPGARSLQERLLVVYERTLADDHPDLQQARAGLADTLRAFGDLAAARALQEQVLAVQARSLPDDHPDLSATRSGLAATLKSQGDLAGARALQEQVLAVQERSFPDDHPDLQRSRINLAGTLETLGDSAGARGLQERALGVLEQSLPDDHPLLQAARASLAGTLSDLGDSAGARALQEKVLAVLLERFPDDHPDLQHARHNLAVTLRRLGDLAGARALEEKVLAVLMKRLPDGHPDLQLARQNLAGSRAALGDHQGARTLLELGLAHLERTLPDDHPWLCSFRCGLAGALWRLCDRPAFAEQIERLAAGLRAQARSGWLLSQRERLERLQGMDRDLAQLLSLTARVPEARELALDVFAAVEESRELSAAQKLGLDLGDDPVLARLASRSRELRARLAAYMGSSVAMAVREQDLSALVRERDEVEGLIARRLAVLGVEAPRIELADLQRALGPEACVAGLRGYDSIDPDGARPSARSLLAHLVKADGSLVRVELGEWDPIGAAVERWRGAIGTAAEARGLAVGGSSASADDERAAGAELARLVLAPILAAAGEVKEIHVCLDDALHLVPLDALPFEDKLLGERVAVHTEVSFGRLLAARREIGGESNFVALGGVDYDAEPRAAQQPVLLAMAAPPVERLERGGGAGPWSYLPGTLDETRGIATRFESAFGREAQVLTGPSASKAAMFEAAQGARFVHLATHGWYAPESVRSLLDPVPQTARTPLTHAAALRPAELGLWTPESTGARVLGMAPMTLCGLALAGANRGPDANGRSDGILTAEELAAFDLAQCELAVLSACETNVGRTRAGQAVQSLQAALHAAGARTAITSLWKVDDAATRELFEDLYTRIWVRGEPKSQALWNAKMSLRAKGHPTRDWAGWVLTGDPD